MVESKENPLENKATSQKSKEQEANPYNQKKDYLDYDELEKAKQSSFADANTLLGQKVDKKGVASILWVKGINFPFTIPRPVSYTHLTLPTTP